MRSTFPGCPVSNATRRQTLAALAWGLAGAANADWASKPIRLVVPFPVGAGADAIGRLLARGLARELNETVIVENVAGATGRIGTARVAHSAPDGHTLGLGFSSTHAIAPALFPDLPYAPEQDFVAIAHVATAKTLVLAHPSFPAQTLSELIAVAQRSLSPLAFGSWGAGSAGHMVVQAIGLQAHAGFVHVPYRGVAPMLQDLLGAQITLGTADIAPALPLLQSARLKALAVTGKSRSPQLPDVPTLRESGVPLDADGWYGLFAPAHTPAPRVDELARAMDAVLRSTEVVEGMTALGMPPDTTTRMEFDRQWREDIITWRRIVRASGAKAD